MPQTPAGAPDPADSPAPHTLELDLLMRDLDLARSSAGFVRLTGEPWIGKSHLLRTMAAGALRQGWRVAVGQPPRGRPGRPFDALVDALDQQLRTTDPALLEGLGHECLRLLARVFPALGARPGQPERGDHCDAYETFRALRDLLERLAGRTGLVLVLDDAHRASPAVCDFAAHLLRHPPDAPVLTVLAHRTGPSDRLLSALEYEGAGLRHIRLRPLTERQALALLPPGIEPLRRQLVLRDAAGVPGLLRALAGGERGRPVEGPHSSLELATGVPPLMTASPAVDLHALSALGWRTACAAAVAGDPCNPSVVAATAQLPLEDVLRGMDELHGEGIVRAGPRAGFRFVQPAVRALVYHAAGAGWRHAARERALTALRAAPGADCGSVTSAAALLEDVDALSAQDERLLDRAVRDTLFLQPGRAARAARRMADRPGAPLEAHLLRCKALVLCGRSAEAADEYAQLWPRLRTAGAGAAREDAVVWRARALRMLGAYPAARRVLDPPAAAPWPLPGPGGGAGGGGGAHERYGELTALLLESGGRALGAALVAAESAVREVPEHDVLAHAHALARLGAVHAATGSPESALDAAGRAGSLLSGLDDVRVAAEVEALRWLGEAEAEAGDPRQARTHLERGFRIALRFGQGHLLGRLALGLGRACLRAGDLSAATLHAEFANSEFTRPGQPLTAAAQDLMRNTEMPDEVNSPIPLTALLSNREHQIAELIGPGLTNQQIAASLNISVKTVETHMGRIFKKLGVRSRAQVVYLNSLNPAIAGPE
ncbi:LuxR C-terminal-related transcriptional regulator [Streptomyces sp. NPDC059917]|uniref:helix-turn-helix transcriptional regulator n=1 Tax=Streptomyces sp. NPDC059917 TaxID=3347002 RepID=UPI003646A77C